MIRDLERIHHLQKSASSHGLNIRCWTNGPETDIGLSHISDDEHDHKILSQGQDTDFYSPAPTTNSSISIQPQRDICWPEVQRHLTSVTKSQDSTGNAILLGFQSVSCLPLPERMLRNESGNHSQAVPVPGTPTGISRLQEAVLRQRIRRLPYPQGQHYKAMLTLQWDRDRWTEVTHCSLWKPRPRKVMGSR